MKLVVDTNRVVAALIADSTCRKILLKQEHEFIAPEFSREELEKHKHEILEKSGLSQASFDLVMSLLLDNIQLFPVKHYSNALNEAKALIAGRDTKDVPFLALAIAENAEGIWSDDKDFESQKKVRIYTTKELI